MDKSGAGLIEGQYERDACVCVHMAEARDKILVQILWLRIHHMP